MHKSINKGPGTEAATEVYIEAPSDALGETALGEDALPFYESLVAYLWSIPYGNTDTNRFSYSIWFAYDDLGCYEKASAKTAAVSRMEISQIRTCIIYEYGYLLWWSDTYEPWSLSSSCTEENDGITLTVNVTIPILDGYGTDGIINADAIDTATDAFLAADAIVDKYAGESDEDKLAAYADEICSLTDYSLDTEGNNSNMINVFDGDPDTLVKCDGFALAFQYLCARSDFDNTSCFYVVGYTRSGNCHAWNIVWIGGNGYYADVTACNSDWNAVLFPASETEDGGYLCSFNDTTGLYKNTDTRTYSTNTKKAIPESILDVDG